MSQESATDSFSDLDEIGNGEEDTDFGRNYSSWTLCDDGNLDVPSCDSDEVFSVKDASRRALLAAEKLCNIGNDVDKLFQDGNLVRELEDFVKNILLFSKAESIGGLRDYEDQDYAKCIVSIFNSTFFRVLLDVRRQFFQMVSVPASHRSGDVLKCYVEYFFACCPDFISSLSGCRRDAKRSDDELSSTFFNQREEGNLRVASQLPQTWQQFPGLLRSEHASPASKRLALCILFAVFVVRPDLEDCDPWTESEIKPRHVLECLRALVDELVSQARGLTFCQKDPVIQHLRTAYAMAIVLYASAEEAIQRREGPSSAFFEPHTSAFLLELMHYVLLPLSECPTETIAWNDLDDARAIILQWGSTVPYAWQKWDDPRVISFDTVVTLTSNWLCHLDKSLSIILWEGSCIQTEEERPLVTTGPAHALTGAVRLNPRMSLIALFSIKHQIRDESTRGSLSISQGDSNLLRLYRTTWCLADLIENCGDILASDDLSLVTEQLVLFFAELNEAAGGRGSEIKEEILRCLNALDSGIIEKVFLSFYKNITFFTKIAAMIARISRMISSDAGIQFFLQPGEPRGLIAFLDFISLCYKCNAARSLPVTTLSLLSDLVKLLQQFAGTPSLRVALLNCLVYAHEQCQTNRSSAATGEDATSVCSGSDKNSPAVKLHKTWDDEGAYNLALDMIGTNLELAAALASYVSLTIKKSTDPLLVAETWDYLLDVLLILMTGRLEECGDEYSQTDPAFNCDAATSVSASERETSRIVNATETICTALEALLKRSDAVGVRLLLESPLTISLHESLNRLETSVQSGPSDETVAASTSVANKSPSPEEHVQVDPRVVRTCTRFLGKLKKIEADLSSQM